MMIPEIKKTITKFFLEESGKSSKCRILSMGLISFALSAGAVTATSINSIVQQHCVAKDSSGRFTTVLEVNNDRDDEGDFNLCMRSSIDDLKLTGVLTYPTDPKFAMINSPSTEVWDKFSNHVSDNNGNCHVSDHFDSQDCVLDTGKIFFHKNELTLANSDSSILVAQHSHEIDERGGKFACHMSDHWSQGDGLCLGDSTDHINSEGVTYQKGYDVKSDENCGDIKDTLDCSKLVTK
jgi:hypothetical protein